MLDFKRPFTTINLYCCSQKAKLKNIIADIINVKVFSMNRQIIRLGHAKIMILFFNSLNTYLSEVFYVLGTIAGTLGTSVN